MLAKELRICFTPMNLYSINSTESEVVFAWLLAKKPWIVPIPGTTKRDRLDENLGAADVQLSDSDVATLEEALSKVRIEGARYPEFHQKLVGR